MVIALLVIGLFGLLGLSVLCPLLALPGYLYARSRSRTSGPIPAPALIEILIPAFNEAAGIGPTLSSLNRAIEHLNARSSNPAIPKIHIKVAADGCTDQTAVIAQGFPNVSVIETRGNRGKWVTIQSLVANSSSDWIILVDAGTTWPENFLTNFVHRVKNNPKAIGIAPSCWPPNAGMLHHIVWDVETVLKRLEMTCGGPVSLHGPTVGYKTDCLKKALAELGSPSWTNDDVVIPLMLRTLYPESIILYPAGTVSDGGFTPDKLDLQRRRRMLLGNLQWIKALLPRCFRRNPVAGMVAVRRLFRLLWAYWLAFIGLGLGLSFHVIVLPFLAVTALCMALSGSFRQLAGAAWISLLAPFLMARSDASLREMWK